MPSSAPRTTRRGFLRLAGATAAFGALAQVRAVPAAAVSGAAGESFFSATEREILAQVVERIVETGDPEAPRVRETGALATIDGLCASLPADLTRPLPILLRLVEYGPLLFDLRLARFSSLDAAGRDEALQSWMTSRFAFRRMGFLALRNLAFVGWYSQEETWPLVDYRGPLLRESGREPPGRSDP